MFIEGKQETKKLESLATMNKSMEFQRREKLKIDVSTTKKRLESQRNRELMRTQQGIRNSYFSRIEENKNLSMKNRERVRLTKLTLRLRKWRNKKQNCWKDSIWLIVNRRSNLVGCSSTLHLLWLNRGIIRESIQDSCILRRIGEELICRLIRGYRREMRRDSRLAKALVWFKIMSKRMIYRGWLNQLNNYLIENYLKLTWRRIMANLRLLRE